MKTRVLEEINALRKNDIYATEELKEELQKYLFPASTKDLVLDLSNVTSAFYGILLKNIGEKIGFENIDEISKKTFYDIGKIKAQQCSEKMESLPRDTRAFFIILVSALYNASPEYSIKSIEYTKEKTVFECSGKDRYLRILNQLGIAKYITFPTLLAFFDGIKDFLKIKSEMTYDMEINNEKNEVIYIFRFNENLI